MRYGSRVKVWLDLAQSASSQQPGALHKSQILIKQQLYMKCLAQTMLIQSWRLWIITARLAVTARGLQAVSTLKVAKRGFGGLARSLERQVNQNMRFRLVFDVLAT